MSGRGPVVVERAGTDAALEELIAVHRGGSTDAPPSIEDLRHQQSVWPGLSHFVARLDGDPVGSGFAGSFPGAEADTFARAHLLVLPAHRGSGIGSELYRAVSAHARSLGKEGLMVEAREDDPESLAWLARRGFDEVERQKAVALDLTAIEPSAVDPPPGVEIVPRGDRSDLERGMYEVALEANADIPGLDSAWEPTFEQWRAFELERPSRRPDLSFVALAGDEVVGHASLDVYPGAVYHGLTAVRRDWRRRGVGGALKRAQIAAAKAAGFTRLETESEESNVPMRRLNERLGYRPIPGMVVLRGPLLT